MSDKAAKRAAAKEKAKAAQTAHESGRLERADTLRKQVESGSAVLSVESQSLFNSVCQKPDEEALWKLFKSIDKDDNNWITKDEFQYMYNAVDKMGVPDGPTSLDKIMQSYNMLDDDKLSFDEFSILMLKIALW
eukprot:TRINITY_DN66683_c4_g2_i1.p1 TRINITY_DN66683_c4_g2~~TRINITY_DN66683_c4_g2_i1.p1  ORF type:complete len:134 (-),score=28.69 TRINITY_DN66683_c4_g2_i1:65-466(-)